MRKKKRKFDLAEFVLYAIFIIGLIGYSALILGSVASLARKDQICLEYGCTNTRSGNGLYCRYHQMLKNAKQRENQVSTKKNTTDSYTSAPSSRKNVNSNYKRPTTSMPDCDDYDSYEDFMDDWDGNMPDGSDASDYWDDW